MTLLKRDNLFIWKEGGNDKTFPYEVSALSILFVFSGKTLAIQITTIWSQQFKYLPYYKLIPGDTVTLDYWVSINAFSMLEDT